MDITPMPDGRMRVTVHQVVKDNQGNLIADGIVNHFYTIEHGLVRTMVIETP